MTDTTPTPGSDEELSAAIDGELEADRVRALRADPANAGRIDLLEGAAALGASPVEPLADDAVDDLIAQAIGVGLAPPASTRATRGPAPWLVAAAVLVLLAVGLTLVWTGRNGDEQDVASFEKTSAEIADDGAGGADAAATAESSSPLAPHDSTALLDQDGTAEAGDDAAATTTAPATGAFDASTLVDLGTFADGDELREALAGSFPSSRTTTGGEASTLVAPAAESAERCATQLKITLELDGDPVAAGYASVADRQVLVYEFATESYEDGTATTLVAAVGADACDQVVIFER